MNVIANTRFEIADMKFKAARRIAEEMWAMANRVDGEARTLFITEAQRLDESARAAADEAETLATDVDVT